MNTNSQSPLDTLSELTPDKLGAFVREQITDPQATSVLYGSPGDERPEDVVVELLRVTNLKPASRKAIISALKTIAVEIFGVLQDFTERRVEFRDDPDSIKLQRWTSTIDRAAPTEMKATCRSLFHFAVEAEPIPSPWRNAFGRAAVSFFLEPRDEGLWAELLKDPTLCALAYRALLKIGPQKEDRVDHLISLWSNRLKHNWKVNTEFLTIETIRMQGSAMFMKNLAALRHHNQALHDEILECLKSSRIQELRNRFN